MHYRPNTSALHSAIHPSLAVQRQRHLDASAYYSLLAENYDGSADALATAASEKKRQAARNLARLAQTMRQCAAAHLSRAAAITDWRDDIEIRADAAWHRALLRLSITVA